MDAMHFGRDAMQAKPFHCGTENEKAVLYLKSLKNLGFQVEYSETILDEVR